MREILDRGFASNDWSYKFPLYKLSVTHTICSYHGPIILDLVDVSYSRKQFRFRFGKAWLKEHTFHNEVSSF